MFCNISLFRSLPGLSKCVYKATLPCFLFFFLDFLIMWLHSLV